jgi:hypothetical protein
MIRPLLSLERLSSCYLSLKMKLCIFQKVLGKIWIDMAAKIPKDIIEKADIPLDTFSPES